MVQKPLGFEMRDFVYYLEFLISRFLDEFLQFLAGAFADVVFHQICFGKSCLFVYIKDLREKTIDDLVGIKDILGCVTACVRQGNLAVMLMFQQFQFLQGIHGPVDTWLGDTQGTGNICDAHFLTFRFKRYISFK